MSITLRLGLRSAQLALAGLALTLLAGCERPPITAVQSGYRGTGMEQVNNPRTDRITVALNQAPPSAEAASADGPKASQVYQNVKVLGHLSVAEFSRHMAAITEWVAPKEGCTYCHNAQNFADDGKYTKIVARRMVQMTQHLNADWKPHVGATGVTCYTCHRGVNCTFCHNTRNFASWSEAPPQRVTAWHGIRMARDLNVAYMEPLTATFPPNRLGVKGDVAKVNCATCHQGVNKPLLGAAMAKNHPELLAPYQAPAEAAPAPAAASAPAVVAAAAATKP